MQLDWQLVEAELLERAVFTAPGGWSGPRITDTAAPPGRLDQPYAWSVGASGGAAPLTWSVTDGSLPAGLSLATNGTISGRPGADGTRTLTLQATDAAGRAARQRFSLRVDGIEIVGGPPAAPYAEPYAAQLSAVGGRTPYSWTVASGSLPPGIGLSGSGALAGESDQPGSYSATVRVTDAGGRSASRSLTLTVLPPEPEVLPLATAQYALPLEDGTLALVVNEQEQNEDRNGDGDLFDAVITLRLPDGSLRNTGVPMASTSSWPELPVALPGGGMMGVSQYVAGDGSGEVFWLDAAHQAHYVDSVREPVLLEDGSFLVCPLTADGQGTELRRVTRDGGPGEPMMTFASTFGCGDVVPLADGGYAFSAPATPGEDPGAVDTVSVWWITRPGSAPVATPLLTPGVALPTAGGSLLVWASDTHWSSEGGWYHVSPDLTITNLNIDESGRAGLADQPYVAADDTGAALVGVSELGDPTDSDDDRDLNHDGDAVDLVRWLVRPDGSTLQLPWASGGEWSARGLADGFGFWTEVPGSDTGAFRVVDSEGALAATLPGWDVKATGRSGFTAIQTEADLGADLTGDGDQADLSPVLYAPPYGPAPSGLASDNGYLITYEAWGLHDGGMSFMAWESPEGGDKGSGTGRDLNGDGDTTDVLPTVVDPGGRVTVWPDPNTRIQAPLPGGGFVGHTYETFDDLNGDGDTNDQVLNLTDGDGHAVNLGVAGWVPTHGRSADCRFPCAYDGWSWTIRQPAPVLASGDLVLIASERANMQDYNGDGDRLDFSPLLVGV